MRKYNKYISWKTVLIILAAIAAIVALFAFALFSVRNKAISYEEQIKTAKSEIKIQEKRRVDLLPNLVECVKAYDKHEYETLMAIVEARNSDSDISVDQVQSMITAVAENYPELQASENYQQLMTELAITENKISEVRTNYNKWIARYSRYVKNFPNYIILDFLGYAVEDFQRLDFDVSEDAPNLDFD